MGRSSRRLRYRNRLLSLLPDVDLRRLKPQLRRLDLPQKAPLYEAGQPMRNVYFVESGVASLVATMQEGGSVEVATIGNEGMVGLNVFLGSNVSSLTTFMQVPGPVLCMSAEDFRKSVGALQQLSRVLHLYTQALFTHLSQSVACNRLHPLQQRCARWLLHTHDRVDSDEFPLTHEFLAQMLGVRRAGVTEAARALQEAGAIRYQQGRVEVLDRQRLEEAACECYGIIVAEYERLLGPMSPTQ